MKIILSSFSFLPRKRGRKRKGKGRGRGKEGSATFLSSSFPSSSFFHSFPSPPLSLPLFLLLSPFWAVGTKSCRMGRNYQCPSVRPPYSSRIHSPLRFVDTLIPHTFPAPIPVVVEPRGGIPLYPVEKCQSRRERELHLVLFLVCEKWQR